jgi:hypothetical protein
MSQENHNSEMELSNLQVQYQSLQEKFCQQEIVNNGLIHEMLHVGISNFKRRNAEIILTYGLLSVTACWSWYRFDLRFSFMAISVVLFAVIGIFEWVSCQKILKIGTEGSDVQTLVRRMEKARTRFSLLWIAGVLALCLWMMWFVSEIGEKLAITNLRSSFIIIAAILTLSIVLIICNIDRLVKMSDELLAQTSRRDEATTTSAYRHSATYWTGLAMLALSLVGLVFKLMHWPFGAILFLLVGLVGVVYVVLTARHLARVVPEERLTIRIAEAASLFLVVSLVFRMMHYPFSGLLGLVGLSLFVIAILVGLIVKR